jgi:hypothetical protein
VTVNSRPFNASTATCSPANNAVDEDQAAFAHLAVLADERLGSCRHGPSSGGDSFTRDERPEGCDREADRNDERRVDVVRRWSVAEEER